MMLSTDIWVAALIRRVELAGSFAVVVRKGDARAGSVLVKVLNRGDGRAGLLQERLELVRGTWDGHQGEQGRSHVPHGNT